MRTDADGTAWLGSLAVPLPPALSPAARHWLRHLMTRADPTRNLTADAAIVRQVVDAGYAEQTARYRELHPEVTTRPDTVGGVPCQIVSPARPHPTAVLINLHGGAFVAGQGSLFEAIPIAARTGCRVVAVDYRLAPEHPFPAAVDDALSVYRSLLQHHAPAHLAVYGASAGAVLGAQLMVAVQAAGLPVPAALGFFSGTADFSLPCDSEAYLGVAGLGAGVRPVAEQARGYLGDWDRTDPRLSPQRANLAAFPPTLCMTATRDFFLGGTCRFHQALHHAGVAAELLVYEGLPHVHWKMADLPESQLALDAQAAFLARHLGVG